MRRRPVPIAAAALVLAGCTMMPRYSRPPLPVPPAWPADAPSGTGEPAAADETRWQEFFRDERLREVIELALANNRDLRIAGLRVEEAQALYRIQRSELLPGVGVQATGEKYRLPEKMNSDGRATIVEDYTVAVGIASWEPDFFGRLRSLEARALNEYLATEHARAAGQIALVAAVAGAYLATAADGESLELARSTLAAHGASLDMIRRSRELGLASDLDLHQEESQVELARASLAAYTGRVAVDRHALDVLAGTPVPAELLPARLSDVAEPSPLSAGLPSEVLLRRPDILSAERRLQAANANIGVARAAFFPRITLTGGVGTMSPELSGLFGSGTRTWSFTPQLLAPIFAGGSLRANLHAAETERAIAVAEYEKAIQTAFAEVSDALTLRETLLAQRDAEESLVRALDATYRLAEARYRSGIDGYLGVLVAERSLYAAQQALVNVRLAERANLVTLYKVLGGGA